MTVLVADRNTAAWQGDIREQPAGAAAVIFAGALLMRNAAGFIVKGATAVGCFGVGVAEQPVNNATGANGALNARYRHMTTARFRNSSAGDLIVQADVGKICWIVDDDQVAKTNGTATRSPAGIIEALDTNGVWVRFDEHLTRAS